MIIRNHYCINCGKEHKYQASGRWSLDYEQNLNSDKYCPDCRRIEINYLKKTHIAFKKVPKVTETKNIVTNEVNIDTLLEWETLNDEENREYAKKHGLLPPMKQVFSSLYNPDRNEFQRIARVEGREDKIGRHYHYNYWPSKKDEAIIEVYVRVDCLHQEIIDYI